MSIRKDFSSLKKHRHSGVTPQNLLGTQVQKIGIPTDPFQADPIFVANPADLAHKTRSQDIKTCFYLPIPIIDSGLHEPAKLLEEAATVVYNDSKIVPGGANELFLHLLGNGEFFYFQRAGAYLDKMVIPQGAIRHVIFSADDLNALFILQRKFGFILVNFLLRATKLRGFLQANGSKWIGRKLQVGTQESLDQVYQHYLSKRANKNKDPETVLKRSETSGDTKNHEEEVAGDEVVTISNSDDVLQNGLPSKLNTIFIQGRKTRATTKMMEEDPELYAQYAETIVDYQEEELDDDMPVIQETPAPFDPPLKYTLSNGKKFIIAYNDFKTLYNNDWINDTLIDFFIAFDMDHATNELHLIEADSVYAFNSFFFTKLMSNPQEQETPDYYGNIKRWLNKIDLMTYDSIILPINEHLHWFCAVIKSMPQLVEAARAYHARYGPNPEDEETGKRPKVEAVVEVFVFDSLKQTHSNIGEPLRIMIDEYCKDKYGVLIPPELIKVQSARVPKQKNFNDCGIHVIYNVRKWLSDPGVCEKVWRKFGRSQRAYFNGSERNGMRRACIEFLLDLHAKQPTEEVSNLAGSEEAAESDDEIELISYHSNKPEEPENKEESGEEVKTAENNAGSELEGNGKVSNLTPREEPKTAEMPERSMSPKTSNVVGEAPHGNNLTSDNLAVSNGSAHLIEKKQKCALHDKDAETRGSDFLVEKIQTEKRRRRPVRTLDPRAMEVAFSPDRKPDSSRPDGHNFLLPVNSEKDRTLAVPFQIEHPQIRRACMALRVKPHTLKFINELFADHTRKFSDRSMGELVDFVKSYNFFDPQTESTQCERLITSFMEKLRLPPPPIEEPFVIQEADDSNGELNQSVSDLKISSDDSVKSRHSGDTPEATRRFLRQTEMTSPVHTRKLFDTSLIETRQSSRGKVVYEDSDLEVLGDDEVLIIDGSFEMAGKSEEEKTKEKENLSGKAEKWRTVKEKAEKGKVEKRRGPERLNGDKLDLSDRRRKKVLETLEIPDFKESRDLRKFKDSRGSPPPAKMKHQVFEDGPTTSRTDGSRSPQVYHIVSIPDEDTKTRKVGSPSNGTPRILASKRRRVVSDRARHAYTRGVDSEK